MAFIFSYFSRACALWQAGRVWPHMLFFAARESCKTLVWGSSPTPALRNKMFQSKLSASPSLPLLFPILAPVRHAQESKKAARAKVKAAAEQQKHMNMKHLEAPWSTPPLLADFIPSSACKPKCKKSLTLPQLPDETCFDKMNLPWYCTIKVPFLIHKFSSPPLSHLLDRRKWKH